MSAADEDDSIKEVYARFGLAIYFAQVLEHGIVNALTILDLIPSRRHLARSQAEWEAEVDSFMDKHFETTMGRMLNNLRSVTTVPNDLESILRDALSKRNFLAHGFFRHHAENLFSAAGRDKMLPELDECRNLFQEADSRLDALVSPLRREAGITDEWLERELKRRSQGEGA